jgi:hypothetical protein
MTSGWDGLEEMLIKAVEEALQKYKAEVMEKIPEEFKDIAEEEINEMIKDIMDGLKESLNWLTSLLIDYCKKKVRIYVE